MKWITGDFNNLIGMDINPKKRSNRKEKCQWY
jgi:hypothetical protein